MPVRTPAGGGRPVRDEGAAPAELQKRGQFLGVCPAGGQGLRPAHVQRQPRPGVEPARLAAGEQGALHRQQHFQPRRAPAGPHKALAGGGGDGPGDHRLFTICL